MKHFILVVACCFSLGAQAEIVSTKREQISEFTTWSETDANVDGDVLVRISTGLSACPAGVYIKDAPAARNLVATALTAFLAGRSVVFQVWDDRNSWVGSATPYCQVRAVTDTGAAVVEIPYFECVVWDIGEIEHCEPVYDCADECDEDWNCEWKCHEVGEDCWTEYYDICVVEEMRYRYEEEARLLDAHLFPFGLILFE